MGPFWPFFQKHIREVTHWCWTGKAWLSVSVLIHPKGVLSGWDQDSVQASQGHPHQTLSSMSLRTLLYALVHSHVGTGRSHPQTVPIKLGAWNCPTSLGMLKTTPHHKNVTLGTMQSDMSRSPSNRQSQTRPSDCQMEKRDSSLQRTRLHCSRVQWWRALHHCIQRFALHLLMYSLDAAARPWKPIPWSSLHCSWANLKATWSLEVCSDWLCRKLATSAPQRLSIHWPALSFYVAYHFVAELLSFPFTSTLL